MLAGDRAGVAHLTAGLTVKRRAVEDEGQAGALAGFGRVSQPVLFDDADDSGLALCACISQKLVAVMILLLECVERAGGKDRRGLGCPARDFRVLLLLSLESRPVDP